MNSGDFSGFTIGVVGLGLIGGSMAKAVKAYTDCRVWGFDNNPEVLEKALSLRAIDEKVCEEIPGCDIILIGLYPHDAVAFIRNHLASFRKGTVVVDLCGIKGFVCREAAAVQAGSGIYFIGGHPMAGIEKSGFDSSFAELFKGSSMILTPGGSVPGKILQTVSEFFLQLGFGHIEVTTSEIHDRIIAYTSQLAHVVSSAYMKSPTAGQHMGFSAGSFRDLTRVAKLNPDMWTELFLLNRDSLCGEIDFLIENLKGYRDVIRCGDEAALHRMLQEGSDIKERLTRAEEERKLARNNK